MFLHEYFVVVSIAAVMNAFDFLWGIVVGLVLACIIMVVNVSRCCKRRAWHAHDRAALQRDSVRQVVSGAVDPLRPHNALDDRALVCTPGWCCQNTRALTHSRMRALAMCRPPRQLCTWSDSVAQADRRSGSGGH